MSRAEVGRSSSAAPRPPSHCQKKELKRRLEQRDADEAGCVAAPIIEPVRQCARTGRWRTSRERDLAAVADPHERARVEERVREKWVKELSEVIVEAGLPAAEEAARTMDPEKALARCAGNRRGKTVRQRVRALRPVLRWLRVEKGLAWPDSVSDMIDYLAVAEVGGDAHRRIPPQCEPHLDSWSAQGARGRRAAFQATPPGTRP